MKKFNLVATTSFGIESILKKELLNLGFEDLFVENGKINYRSDINGIIKSNINLRTAERIFISLGEFKAETFDELFDNLTNINFEDFLPKDANFIINARSVKSKLFSIRTIQSISEKAIITRLQKKYNILYFDKTFSKFNIEIVVLNDYVSVLLDTSGIGLHKRGWRTKQGEAPLKETLASAIILLSFYKKDRLLIDLFCGSGTIAIEAAMIANNIAPNLNRSFICEDWNFIDKSISYYERDLAKSKITNEKLNIFANDINQKVLDIAKQNAKNAGVYENIKFLNKDFRDFNLKNENGILISNPPYGERLLKKEDIIKINHDLKNKFKKLDKWNLFLLTSDEFFETGFKRKADKKRKLYNGNLKVIYYQYFGKK